jgi:hypothetical protein
VGSSESRTEARDAPAAASPTLDTVTVVVKLLPGDALVGPSIAPMSSAVAGGSSTIDSSPPTDSCRLVEPQPREPHAHVAAQDTLAVSRLPPSTPTSSSTLTDAPTTPKLRGPYVIRARPDSSSRSWYSTSLLGALPRRRPLTWIVRRRLGAAPSAR